MSEIRKALNLLPASSTEFRRCLCVAIFIILESRSEKLWHQNYKLRHQNYKLRPQSYTSLLTTITVNCLYNKEQIAFSNFFVFRMDEKGEKSKVFIDHKVFANLTIA